MAKILIDTNILYDLAGINDSTKSSIDFEVLKNELSNLGELHVSWISLVEMYTCSRLTTEQRTQVINYIKSSNLHYLESSESFLNEAFYRGDVGQSVIDKSLTLKERIESETLASCIANIYFAFFYFVFNYIDDPNKKNLFTFQSEVGLSSNLNHFRDESERFISNYYENGIKLNNQMDEILHPVFLFLLYNYQASMKSKIISLLPSSFTWDVNLPLYSLQDKLEKAKNGNEDFPNGVLCDKNLYWTQLDAGIESTKSFCENYWPQSDKNFLLYYLVYARKYLTSGKKFDKNNLIDSQFHFYDEKFTVYTLDKFLIETYQGSSQYNSLVALQNSVKKQHN